MNEEGPPVSILLLGDPGVGKSTFLSRLATGPTAPTSTILRPLPHASEPLILELRQPSLRLELSTLSTPNPTPTTTPSILILCYTIPSLSSLLNLQTHWRPLITSFLNDYNESPPVLLLGLQRERRGEVEGAVLPQEGLRAAQEMGCDGYAECSTVSGELCKEVWEDVVRMAVGLGGQGDAKGQQYCGVM